MLTMNCMAILTSSVFLTLHLFDRQKSLKVLTAKKKKKKLIIRICICRVVVKHTLHFFFFICLYRTNLYPHVN